MGNQDDFLLSLSSDVEAEVKAKVPTGRRNGWREITFFAYFEPQPQGEMRDNKLSVAESMEKALKRVDFGTLKLADSDQHGNPLTPLQIAMGNVYTYNALLRVYREDVLTKNVEGKR
jgi:hypothetical protein